MFRAYLDQPERYAKCFHDTLYLTGDLVRRDADGYFWFLGRSDDVIKTSGHLVGPFEIERVLMEHAGSRRGGGDRLAGSRWPARSSRHSSRCVPARHRTGRCGTS